MPPVIHPFVVHFPIAFYSLELFLLILWITKKDEGFRRFAQMAFWLAYWLMVTAMVAGYVDARGINSKVRNHFISALTLFSVCTVRAFLWRRMAKTGNFNQKVLTAGAVLGVVLLTVTGDLGARMVYEY